MSTAESAFGPLRSLSPVCLLVYASISGALFFGRSTGSWQARPMLISTAMRLSVPSLLLCAPLILAGCGNDDGSTIQADATVADAAAPDAQGQTSCGSSVPSASGEFYLALAASVAPAQPILFIATTVIDDAVIPATFSMTLQPLCTQDTLCTVRQHVGSPIVVETVSIAANCSFDFELVGADIPAGANSIGGVAATVDVVGLGSIQGADGFCGTADGTATIGETVTDIDDSSFGSIRITPGTLGDDLPEPEDTCLF